MDGSLAWAIQRAVRVSADATAVIDRGTGTTLTYAQVHDRVARLGAGLEGLGVEAGTVVGVLALNSHQHLEAWLAIPRLRAVLNDLNIRLARPELQFIVDDCKTSALIVDDFHLETGLALLESCASLRHLVHTGTATAPEGVVRYFSSLRGILYGASPMPIEILRRAMELIPCDWMQGYGMTEAAPMVSVLPASDHRRGAAGKEPYATRLRSAGTAVVGVQAEPRGTDGSVLPDGEVGDLWTRCRNIMKGYWNRTEETGAALPGGGWYRTGDAGYVDTDGYLFLVDRVKDISCPAARTCTQPRWRTTVRTHRRARAGCHRFTRRPLVRTSPRRGRDLARRRADQDELIEYCRGRIAGYKAPRSVEFRTEALPKSGAGKILKRDLCEPHWERQIRRVHREHGGQTATAG